MKSSTMLLAVAASAALFVPNSSPAQYYDDSYGANGRPYFRVGIGPAFTADGSLPEFSGFAAGNQVKYDTGFAFDGAIGFTFNRWISAEFETGMIANEISQVEGFALDDTFLFNVPFMANVTLNYTIPRTIVTPYIGAGLGGSVTGFDTDYFSNGDVSLYGSDATVVFAYQFYAGVRFEINNQMSVAVGYKYFATEDADFSFESFNYGQPDLHLGFEGVTSHIVTVAFNMRF